MSEEIIGHVSLQRAYQAVVQTLAEMRENDEVSRALDEGVIKKLLTESFAFQFEDDQTVLEKRVTEILEEKVDSQKQAGDIA